MGLDISRRIPPPSSSLRPFLHATPRSVENDAEIDCVFLGGFFFFDIGFDKGIRQIFNLLEILLFIFFFFEKYGSECTIELKVGYYLSEEENFRPL